MASFAGLNDFGQFAADLDGLQAKVVQGLFELHFAAAVWGGAGFAVVLGQRNRLEAFWADGRGLSLPFDAMREYDFVFHDVHVHRLRRNRFFGNPPKVVCRVQRPARPFAHFVPAVRAVPLPGDPALREPI